MLVYAEAIVHNLYGIAPLSAARFCDLFERNGKDDFFSSDLTKEEMSERLGHMRRVRTVLGAIQSHISACFFVHNVELIFSLWMMRSNVDGGRVRPLPEG